MPSGCSLPYHPAAAAGVCRRFALYNVVGALVWTVLFLGAGFFFGNLPVVQHNFTLVVLGIVAVSVLPVLLEIMAARREHGQSGGGAAGSGAAA
jgi:membrane-associated protein